MLWAPGCWSPTATEGEKAADATHSIGLVATTSAHGAKSPHKNDWSPLAGKDVVILPDNDAPGREYAAQVRQLLSEVSPPARTLILELAGLPEQGDLFDFLEQRDAVEPEALRCQLETLVAAAEREEQRRLAEHQPGPVLTCLADIEPQEVRWLWPGRIPLGRLTLLVGRPGEGKSFVTTDMAARVSTGTAWPDGSECPQGSVVLISAEDDPAAPPRAPAPVVELLSDEHDDVLETTVSSVSKLLYHMGLQAQVSAHYGEPRDDRRPIMVDVRGSDLGILFGRRGQTLDAFQYIAALMVGKATGQFIHLVVDVEGHRDRRERQLRQLAQRMAEQVLKTGRKLTLEPMRPAERRIIHIELREHPAVTTESVGEEPYRKVTIIPKE